MMAGETIPAVSHDAIKLGMHPEDVSAVLHANFSLHEIGNLSIADYRYEDSNAWRYRSVIYFALDGMTFYLAEAFLIPTELRIQKNAQRFARAVFADGGLVLFESRDHAGNVKALIGANEITLDRPRRGLSAIFLGHEFGESN